jgi:3-oxoacyl-[acyl-carrier-protein] synthase III
MRDTVSIGSQTLREVCELAGIDRERIDAFASVQPRGWIPPAIAEHVGLSSDVAVVTYDKYAHVDACGPVANWRHAVASGHRTQQFAL